MLIGKHNQYITINQIGCGDEPKFHKILRYTFNGEIDPGFYQDGPYLSHFN